MKLELATVQFMVTFEGGRITEYLHFDVLQDNLRELEKHVPDGKYKWTLSLDIEKAEKEAISPYSQVLTWDGENLGIKEKEENS